MEGGEDGGGVFEAGAALSSLVSVDGGSGESGFVGEVLLGHVVVLSHGFHESRECMSRLVVNVIRSWCVECGHGVSLNIHVERGVYQAWRRARILMIPMVRVGMMDTLMSCLTGLWSFMLASVSNF